MKYEGAVCVCGKWHVLLMAWARHVLSRRECDVCVVEACVVEACAVET